MSSANVVLWVVGILFVIYVFQWWSLLIPGVLILLWIIRWIADIYWDGKDKGKW